VRLVGDGGAAIATEKKPLLIVIVRQAQSWVMLRFNCFDTALLAMGSAALRENRMLTDAQRAAYDRDGFIVVPDVFSAEDVAGGTQTVLGKYRATLSLPRHRPPLWHQMLPMEASLTRDG